MLNTTVSPLAVIFHRTIPEIQHWSKSGLPEITQSTHALARDARMLPVDPARGQRLDIVA